MYQFILKMILICAIDKKYKTITGNGMIKCQNYV